MSFAFIPIYIKYLGIESYGLIGIFTLLSGWLTMIDVGITPTLNREMARFTSGTLSVEHIRNLLRSIEIIVFGLAILISLTVYLNANWLATSWLNPGKLSTEVVVNALSLMGVVASIRFLENIYRSSILGLQKQVAYNIIHSGAATLRGLGAVAVLIWISPTIEAFFIWQGVVSLITVLVLMFFTYNQIPVSSKSARFSIQSLKSIWRFAAGMMLHTLTGLIINSLDKVLLSKILPLTIFGYYTLATTIISAIGALISPVNQAYFPKFAELASKAEHEAFKYSFHLSAQLLTLIVGSVTIVILFHTSDIIYLWTQSVEIASNTSFILSLLLLATIIHSPVWMLYQAEISIGWTRLGVQINFIIILIAVPLILFFVPKYGAVAAASIAVLTAFLTTFMHANKIFDKLLSKEKSKWLIHDILLPTLIIFLVNLLLFPIENISSHFLYKLVYYSFAVSLSFGCALLITTDLKKKVLSSWLAPLGFRQF